MKKIEVIIQPFKNGRGQRGSCRNRRRRHHEVRGHGRQKGHKEIYRGQEYNVDLQPKLKLEMVVPTDRFEEVVQALSGAARTGKIGDGKIFAFDVSEAGGGPVLPHDLTIAASGGLILWFGWYGFNPGTTLSAMDFDGIGRVATNTILAACAGGLLAMVVAYTMSKKWDVSFTVNGFLAGLVAITCPCYWVSPTGAILLGGVAGIIVVYGVELLEWLRIDDPIGAVPVHGICGIWGTLSLGLFACGKYGSTGPFAADHTAPLKGRFYGGATTVLSAQAVGSAIITLSTFGVALSVMYLVNAAGLLRVSAEGEALGLDLHEHGISAYPEYVISSIGHPAMVVDPSEKMAVRPATQMRPAEH